MRKFHVLVFLLFYVFSLPTAFAQDGTQWHLPEASAALFGATAINATVFSADGTHLAVATANGIALYDTYTGKELVMFPALMDTVIALALSPDNQTLASAGSNTTIHLWNVHTGEHKTEFMGHTYPVVSLAFSPDGNILASGSFEEIRLWNLTTELPRRASVLHGHRDMVTTLAFSPHGKILASTSFYGRILLWDVDTGQLRHNLAAHTDSILALAFSPDNQTLASGGYWSGDAENTIRIWHIHTGQLLRTFEAHTAPVFALAFSSKSDGIYENILVSVGWGNAIRLWNPQTGKLQTTFVGDTAPVLAIAFLPINAEANTRGATYWNTLASAGLDGTIQLWSRTSVPKLADVNADGVVNVLDLTFVVSRLGQKTPDLNGDGIVNILDLTHIAQHIRE